MPKRGRAIVFFFPYLLLTGIIVYGAVYFLVFKKINNRWSSFGTVPLLNEEEAYRGYTLLSPYNRMLNADSSFKGKVYLLDLLGRPVHTWITEHQSLYSVLEPNGNLLTVMEAPKYTQMLPPGGNTGTIQELDWNSKVIWEYRDEHMHHDIVPLSNGNVVVALWEKTPAEVAARIQGGVPGTDFPGGTVWSDELVEIDRKGETVWSWHSYQHLDPEKDILDPTMPHYGWTYTNGIAYTPHNPIDGSEAFLLSYRSLDEIMFVRRSDGEIIWRSPKGMLNTQHDPSILPNGDVMVFDNGFARLPNPFPSYGSRAAEINPRENKVVWSFDGGAGVIDKVRFFAPIVGGAQRLPNGNTFITDGPKGHMFEVTDKGKVVWDMISPYMTKMTGAFPNNFLFKTRKIGENEIKFPGKISPAYSDREFKIYKLLQKIYPF